MKSIFLSILFLLIISSIHSEYLLIDTTHYPLTYTDNFITTAKFFGTTSTGLQPSMYHSSDFSILIPFNSTALSDHYLPVCARLYNFGTFYEFIFDVTRMTFSVGHGPEDCGEFHWMDFGNLKIHNSDDIVYGMLLEEISYFIEFESELDNVNVTAIYFENDEDLEGYENWLFQTRIDYWRVATTIDYNSTFPLFRNWSIGYYDYFGDVEDDEFSGISFSGLYEYRHDVSSFPVSVGENSYVDDYEIDYDGAYIHVIDYSGEETHFLLPILHTYVHGSDQYHSACFGNVRITYVDNINIYIILKCSNCYRFDMESEICFQVANFTAGADGDLRTIGTTKYSFLDEGDYVDFKKNCILEFYKDTNGDCSKENLLLAYVYIRNVGGCGHSFFEIEDTAVCFDNQVTSFWYLPSHFVRLTGNELSYKGFDGSFFNGITFPTTHTSSALNWDKIFLVFGQIGAYSGFFFVLVTIITICLGLCLIICICFCLIRLRIKLKRNRKIFHAAAARDIKMKKLENNQDQKLASIEINKMTMDIAKSIELNDDGEVFKLSVNAIKSIREQWKNMVFPCIAAEKISKGIKEDEFKYLTKNSQVNVLKVFDLILELIVLHYGDEVVELKTMFSKEMKENIKYSKKRYGDDAEVLFYCSSCLEGIKNLKREDEKLFDDVKKIFECVIKVKETGFLIKTFCDVAGSLPNLWWPRLLVLRTLSYSCFVDDNEIEEKLRILVSHMSKNMSNFNFCCGSVILINEILVEKFDKEEIIKICYFGEKKGAVCFRNLISFKNPKIRKLAFKNVEKLYKVSCERNNEKVKNDLENVIIGRSILEVDKGLRTNYCELKEKLSLGGDEDKNEVSVECQNDMEEYLKSKQVQLKSEKSNLDKLEIELMEKESEIELKKKEFDEKQKIVEEFGDKASKLTEQLKTLENELSNLPYKNENGQINQKRMNKLKEKVKIDEELGKIEKESNELKDGNKLEEMEGKIKELKKELELDLETLEKKKKQLQDDEEEFLQEKERFSLIDSSKDGGKKKETIIVHVEKKE